MPRFDPCLERFEHAISRSREMINLFAALNLIRVAPENDDALRAAYFQAVSSFDLLVHDALLAEVEHRARNRFPTRKVDVPLDLIGIADADERVGMIVDHVRKGNSYKSFVDPAKLSEALSCIFEEPWPKIAEKFSERKGTVAPVDELKGQLKSIWGRRNKIAHEADINPVLAGISLWPIDAEDTNLTVDFLYDLGHSLTDTLINLEA